MRKPRPQRKCDWRQLALDQSWIISKIRPLEGELLVAFLHSKTVWRQPHHQADAVRSIILSCTCCSNGIWACLLSPQLAELQKEVGAVTRRKVQTEFLAYNLSFLHLHTSHVGYLVCLKVTPEPSNWRIEGKIHFGWFGWFCVLWFIICRAFIAIMKKTGFVS